jgi:hypothetical protein
MYRDYAAVYAACSRPESNGVTEGHINRLKFLKRQMDAACSARSVTRESPSCCVILVSRLPFFACIALVSSW